MERREPEARREQKEQPADVTSQESSSPTPDDAGETQRDPKDVEGTPDVVVEDQEGQPVEDGGLSEVFTMPQGSDYEPHVVLCSVNPAASAEEVNEALRGLKGVLPVELSDEDISSVSYACPLRSTCLWRTASTSSCLRAW